MLHATCDHCSKRIESVLVTYDVATSAIGAVDGHACTAHRTAVAAVLFKRALEQALARYSSYSTS